jgi:hypothetical protein
MTPTQRGLTVDRMTTDHGIAGWHYKRSRAVDVLFTVVLFACAGIGAFLYLAR